MAILKGKDKEVNKRGKYKQKKKEGSNKMQYEASDKENKHTNSLYSAEIYNDFLAALWAGTGRQHKCKTTQTVIHVEC